MKNLRESVVVRRWKRTDLGCIAESIAREGWGHSIRDVERCWSLEPHGCFLAVIHGAPVGHVFSICYGNLGWIGLLIVDPKVRGRGVGSVLMEAAVSYLHEAGCRLVRLEAVEKAVPLYQRFGFRREFDSLRFRGQLASLTKPGSSGSEFRKMLEEDLANVGRFDARYFGADRLRVLRSLLTDNPNLCYLAEDDMGVSGYIMTRLGEDGFWVGPWVSENSKQAEALFGVLVGAISGTDVVLRVGLPALNGKGQGLLEKLGFQLTDKSVRMVLGSVRGGGSGVRCVYGIGGPEKG